MRTTTATNRRTNTTTLAMRQEKAGSVISKGARPVLIIIIALTWANLAPAADEDLRIVAWGAKILYRKIIVTGETVQFFVGEDEPTGNGKLVAPFAIYHKLKATKDGKEYLEKGKDKYIRVGASDGRALGWLKVSDLPPKVGDLKSGKIEADFIDWDNRFILAPEIPAKDREFTVYNDKELKTAILSLNKIAMGHLGMAPIIRKVGKDADAVYQVVSYTGSARSASTIEVAPATTKARHKEIKLEVVFVIDTTASMAPGIDMMHQVIKQCDKALAGLPELKGEVRFGVIEFRDATASDYKTPAGKFSARVASPLTDDLKALSATIGKLEADGGGDVPEDVLAGLHLAVTGGRESKEVGWSENSSKHIILLGNASAHLSGPGNSTNMSIEGVIKEAKKTAGSPLEQVLGSKCFHAVHILNPNNLKDSDLCGKQFSKIAQNKESVIGFYIDVDPTKAEDRNKGIENLATFLTKGIRTFHELHKRNKTDEKADKILPIFDEPTKSNPINNDLYTILKKTSGSGPTPITLGYAAEHNSKRLRVATVQVMVTHAELDCLRSTLDIAILRLKLKTSPAQRKDVGSLLKMIQTAAAEAVSGQQLKSDQDVHNLIADLPLRPGVLDITSDHVARMDDKEYKDWIARLEEAKKHAEVLLRRDDWIEVTDYSNLNSKAQNKERYLFLFATDLP